MRLLVLGGTAWLGGLVAADAVASGHDVTCLARGESGSVPAGARLVVADRSASAPDADPYAAVPGDWDAVVDVARHPAHVRGAVRALGERAAYLAYVSTVSGYADTSTAGQDEQAPLVEAFAGAEPTDADYGPAKVACEEAVWQGFGADRALVARAGLIGGPGDWSGRTGWWPWRFAHPASPDGAVVVPVDPALSTQVIDARDLAAWLVDCCERATPGLADAVGPITTLAEHLATAREVAGHTGPILEAEPDWLVQQGISPWMGPRSLPLWLPTPEYAGFMSRPGDAARALGLACRPLASTLADTLAWERDRARREGPDRPWRSGLTDAESAELVAAWRRRAGS